jgi:hypothetical protein
MAVKWTKADIIKAVQQELEGEVGRDEPNASVKAADAGDEDGKSPEGLLTS